MPQTNYQSDVVDALISFDVSLCPDDVFTDFGVDTQIKQTKEEEEEEEEVNNNHNGLCFMFVCCW